MRATVSVGRGLNRQSVEVNIPNIKEMSPKAAKSFSKIAFGHANGTTVSGGGKTYRCTRNGVRSVRQ